MCDALLRGVVLFAVAIFMMAAGSDMVLAQTRGTSISISSQPTAVVGSTVTWRVNVTSGDANPPSPTGTITFNVDGVAQATATLQPNGLVSRSASFSLNTLSIGTHSIIFTYSGDSIYFGFTSQVFREVINPLPPTISSISPSNGSTLGGDTVTITGTNLTGASAVTFGASVVPVTVTNDGTATAVAPPHAAGNVNVTVTTPGGTSAVGPVYTYITPVPTISSVSPNSGTTLGGTSVVITGTNFTGASAVTFGGTAATNFTLNSPTQITARAPVHAAGPVDVAVTTPGGTATGSGLYTYVVSTPTISSVSPNSGPTTGSTSIVITGTNFDTGGVPRVTIGGTAARGVIVNGPTQITAITEGHPAGVVDVVVTTSQGTATGTGLFTFVPVVPTLSGFSPGSGSTLGGTIVTITGTNFLGQTAVTFGGTAASFTVDTPTQIRATAPPHAAGSVPIAVTTDGGTATSTRLFDYVAPAPTITNISPNSGSTLGGTTVTITGTNFGAAGVTFGGSPAINVTITPTQITATTLPHAVGPVDVVINTPSGTATGTFTFVAPAPTIASISPNSGTTLGGTTVTLTGTNLTGATGVTFGTLPATRFTVLSDTSVTAVAPAQAVGNVDVTITTPGGTSPVGPVYTYVPAPTIASILPDPVTPLGGVTVLIGGTNLSGAQRVTVDGKAINFVVVSGQQIAFQAPAHAPGQVSVAVITPSGTATGSFSYGIPSPTVAAISPDAGSTDGGTTVTIRGQNLTFITAVTFGGIAATSFTIVNDGILTAVTPAHAAGPVNLAITSDGGTATPSFTYVTPAPTISSVSPNTGSPLGGDNVVISGTDLAGAAAVTFGGTAAASFSFNSATQQITARTPAHAVGSVDVSVTTPGGTVSAENAFTFHQVATTVTLSASANPAMLHQSVTFTAKISPSNAAGTVTFVDGDTPLCSSIAVSGGVAECVTRFTTGGPHPLTAAFLGTGVYANSASPTLTEDVTDQVTKTVQTIGKFLSQRTNQILTNEPDGSRQISRLQEAAGAVPETGEHAGTTTAMLTPSPSRFGDGISGNDFSRMALGTQGSNTRRLANSLPASPQAEASSQGSLPIDMNGSDDGPLHLGFATSLHDMQRVARDASQKKEGLGGVTSLSQPAFNPWDIWFEGTYSRFNDNQTKSDLSGHFGLFTGGVDYVFNPSLLVGVLVQVDTMTQKSQSDQSSVSGTGWMAGPYATVRLTKQLFWQVRAAWGTSSNDVSPFLTYSDSFDTTRWLASTNLTGDWNFGAWGFRPTASIAYMEDNSDSYHDHFGALIPEVRNRLGQAKLGPEIDYRFATPGGGTIEPHATLQAIWNFAGSTTAEDLGSIDDADAGPQGVRARAELGLRMATPSGLGLDISVSYDGIGASGYDDLAGRAAINVPFR